MKKTPAERLREFASTVIAPPTSLLATAHVPRIPVNLMSSAEDAIDAVEDLDQIFGSDKPRRVLSELRPVTGDVLVSPSELSRRLVKKIVRELPLNNILQDLGAIVARELADFIDASALRPADYADLPDLGEVLSERVMQELGRDPDAFSEALRNQLRLRG